MATVLIVDDAEDLCFSLGNLVKKEGYSLGKPRVHHASHPNR